MHYTKRLMILFVALALTGCHALLSKIHIIDIQQGNEVSAQQIQKLHAGMTKTEVSELLGEPVLQNLFTKNRWDYLYMLEQPRHATQERRLTIYFDQDRVVRFDQSDNH